MLFTIKEALEIRNHYKPIMVGTPITNGSEYKIDGVFICHNGNVSHALDILLNNGFDDNLPIIAVTNEKEKNLQVFVYLYDGANVIYDELDKNLNDKPIPKIYASW